jgi:hypothetical protein
MPLSATTRVFVAFCSVLVGASFLLTPLALLYELGAREWIRFAAFQSDVFGFFPIFGLLAVLAFYFPLCVLLNLYFHHLPYGRIRLIVIVIALAAAMTGISSFLPDRSPLWSFPLSTLAQDAGEPPYCRPPTCKRASYMSVLASLQEAASNRVDLSRPAMSCHSDSRLPSRNADPGGVFCFATQSRLPIPGCCEAQVRFGGSVQELALLANRSAAWHAYRLVSPLMSVFLASVIAGALLIVAHRNRIDQYYAEFLPKIERSIIIGASALLFWPTHGCCSKLL